MRTRSFHLVFAALMAACTLGSGAASGCGRIGFTLLPIPDAEPTGPMPGPQLDASQGAVDAMVDARTDPPSDRECATQCTNDSGSSACVEDLCSLSCTSGYADCDGDPNSGCETSLNSATSCGACGNECVNSHGSTACVSEACQPTCDTGYADCDGNPDNGCEADLQNDPSHCGSCPNACGTNGQICVDGACQVTPCAAGLGECDDDLTVTCETDLTSDLDHCGACDAGCTNAHGATHCTGSVCDPTCSSGWGDCDGDPYNGCESPLGTVSNCGMCGRSCSGDGGTPICHQGVCDTLCDLTGTFALHLRVRATWPTTGEVAAGSGWFEWWARLDASHDGDMADVQVRLCGATIPPIRARLVPETSLYVYTDSLFDGGGLPVVSSTLTLGDSTPDSSLTLSAAVFLLGLSMTDPLHDSWPSSASGISGSDRIDMEGDGHPGVTAHFVDSGGYVYPRTSTSLLGYNRADREYVAARTSFSLNGALSSCTESSGNADFPHIQVRVLGCRRDGGGNCDSSEADHLDDSSPSFSTSNGSYVMTKLADGASCATVRSALP